MFHASNALTVLWWVTGLRTSAAAAADRSSRTTTSRLSVVYAAVVYLAYVCLCAAYAADKYAEYVGGAMTTTGKLQQILVIRDVHMALLFVASTAVHGCAVAYRREHLRVHVAYAAVASRLFGDEPSGADRATRACCWGLYALLAVILSLDVIRSADAAAPWTHHAAFSWGHYALLTGNMQFAVTVFGLLRCYRELNERMRAGCSVAGVNGSAAGLPVPDGGATENSPSFTSVCVLPVLDRVDSLTMLKYWTDLHWKITRIVSRINSLFKFRLFVFFLCGLMHLMFTPYLLSLTILNVDIDILPHIIQRALWFVIHIFRVVLVIYPCALLGEEAARTQILLGTYLNTKTDYFDIKKVETYAQQLDANKPEFSIYSMFVIDRQLVVSLTGTVATYLVIIIQLQGQS